MGSEPGQLAPTFRREPESVELDESHDVTQEGLIESPIIVKLRSQNRLPLLILVSCGSAGGGDIMSTGTGSVRAHTTLATHLGLVFV